MRIYAVSDLHADFPANVAFINEAMGRDTHRDDVLIVAGDVSHKLDVLEAMLRYLAATFGKVVFTPGNHDLWLHATDDPVAAAAFDSLDKLGAVQAMCERLGVHTTGPYHCTPTLAIWPLFAWHHASFDQEPDITEVPIAPVHEACADYHRCRWPATLDPATDSVACHFDALNGAPVDLGAGVDLITVSHFLPFQELLPEKRQLFYPNLAKMAGSAALGRRVAAMRPAIHIFGHTHLAWDSTVTLGPKHTIRCIQAPVSYPRERKDQPTISLPRLIFDSLGGFAPPQPTFWSDYYRTHTRDPANTQLAPWVRAKMALH